MSKEEKKDKGKKPANKGAAAKLLGYGLVAMFFMVWVFVLGVLTGRGDMNRLFQRLGLGKTELAARLGMTPEAQPVGGLPVPQPEAAQKAAAEGENKPAQEVAAQTTPPVSILPGKAAVQAASKTTGEAGKKPGTASTQEAKRPKGSTPSKPEQDTSLAARLNFQNSLDTPTRKPPKPGAKKEGAVHTATIAPDAAPAPAAPPAAAEKKKPACAYQVKVASFRTAEEAQKAVADLKKKGINVNLQQGKDKAGTAYIIKTGKYTSKSEAEKVTKKLKEANLSGQIQELKQ